MLSPRHATPILVVSPDAAVQQRLAAVLAPAGAVELHASPDALVAAGAAGTTVDAALCVIHLHGALAAGAETLLPRLGGTCPVIAVMPRASLASAVDVLRAQPRVAGALLAEAIDDRRLAQLADRLLSGDPLGLPRAVAPGTEIHTRTARDHAEMQRCVAAVGAFAEAAGVPRLCRDAAEQCLSEMLMNALYDAPVGADGKALFAGVSARERIAQRTEQRATVQYACDGARFAISVRDAFGTLERQTMLRYLHKCLHTEQQVDRKVSGGGIGLYLMASSAAAVGFHVLPGSATEAVCVFDLAVATPQLEELSFVVQGDPANRAAAPPARRLPAGGRSRVWLAAAVIAGAGAIGGGLGLAGVFGGGSGGGSAAPAPAPPVVEIDSQPPGAAVELDGAPAGSTPLTVTTLAPGAQVSITWKLAGYRTASARLVVPARGETKRVAQPLELSGELVRVRFVSKPAGAEVTRTGAPPSIDRTYTPAELLVEADQAHRFTISMPGRVPIVLEPFTPARGAALIEKGGELPPGATLKIEAPSPGTVTVSRAPHCAALALPAECVLAPGDYTLEYTGADGRRLTSPVTMGSKDQTERLATGR